MLFKIIKPFLKRRLKKEIEGNRDTIVTLLNSRLDLPKLSEEEERKLLEQVYLAVSEAALLAVERL